VGRGIQRKDAEGATAGDGAARGGGDGNAETHYESSVGGGSKGSDANSTDGDPISGLGFLSIGDSLSNYFPCDYPSFYTEGKGKQKPCDIFRMVLLRLKIFDMLCVSNFFSKICESKLTRRFCLLEHKWNSLLITEV
jgi:hypothetical protein